MEDRGLAVNEDLHHDLKAIVAESSERVKNSHLENTFQRIFWENQERASAVKDARSMRWDPMMIRWCLYLKHLSSSGYELIRQSEVIKLPSQRTLRDYTHHTSASSGFSDEVDKQLMQAANIHSCPEREKYVIIIMDEMHIKEDIVYNKHTGIILIVLNYQVSI